MLVPRQAALKPDRAIAVPFGACVGFPRVGRSDPQTGRVETDGLPRVLVDTNIDYVDLIKIRTDQSIEVNH
ncbi:MAG: hypothetical protein EA382_15585 [Spirochaetaceae bacterium]|nr:MAG: hypothetical protein EA382_15585 [Spirochaetaceae bacterium]